MLFIGKNHMKDQVVISDETKSFKRISIGVCGL